MLRNRNYEGPVMTISQEIDEMKYRQKGETFDDKIKRIAKALSDGDEHRFVLEDILGEMRFLPACLLYTSPSPRDRTRSRMPSSA